MNIFRIHKLKRTVDEKDSNEFTLLNVMFPSNFCHEKTTCFV